MMGHALVFHRQREIGIVQAVVPLVHRGMAFFHSAFSHGFHHDQQIAAYLAGVQHLPAAGVGALAVLRIFMRLREGTEDRQRCVARRIIFVVSLCHIQHQAQELQILDGVNGKIAVVKIRHKESQFGDVAGELIRGDIALAGCKAVHCGLICIFFRLHIMPGLQKAFVVVGAGERSGQHFHAGKSVCVILRRHFFLFYNRDRHCVYPLSCFFRAGYSVRRPKRRFFPFCVCAGPLLYSPAYMGETNAHWPFFWANSA